jgi:hypothetical protein
MKFSIKFLLGITAIAALMAAVATLSYRKGFEDGRKPSSGEWTMEDIQPSSPTGGQISNGNWALEKYEE